jgi:hypothetical protein
MYDNNPARISYITTDIKASRTTLASAWLWQSKPSLYIVFAFAIDSVNTDGSASLTSRIAISGFKNFEPTDKKLMNTIKIILM